MQARDADVTVFGLLVVIPGVSGGATAGEYGEREDEHRALDSVESTAVEVRYDASLAPDHPTKSSLETNQRPDWTANVTRIR